MLSNSNQEIKRDAAVLNEVERSIGFYAFDDKRPVNQGNTPDLAEHSKEVGKSISTMNSTKSRIKVQTPIQKHIVKDASFRWTHLFLTREQKAYEEECRSIVAADELLDFRWEAILVQFDFQIERAKTLITVVGF